MTQQYAPALVALVEPKFIETLRNHVNKEAPDDALALYVMRCKKFGADPFDRFFYLNKRASKTHGITWSVETTIDGFRSIAEATGEYDGQDPPHLEFDKNGKFISATVTIYRKGMGRGISATARYDEYVVVAFGQVSSMWQKMPTNQTAKCAESLAFRKAFPKKFSGLYTIDEMGGEALNDAHNGYLELANAPSSNSQSATSATTAKTGSAEATAAPEPNRVEKVTLDTNGPITEQQTHALDVLQKTHAIPNEALADMVKGISNDRSAVVTDLTREEAGKLIKAFQTLKKAS